MYLPQNVLFRLQRVRDVMWMSQLGNGSYWQLDDGLHLLSDQSKGKIGNTFVWWAGRVGTFSAEGQSDKMASDVEERMKKRWVIELLHAEKMHTLTITDSCWTTIESKQWMWAQWDSGWYVSAVATVTVMLVQIFYELSMQVLVQCWWKQ